MPYISGLPEYNVDPGIQPRGSLPRLRVYCTRRPDIRDTRE